MLIFRQLFDSQSSTCSYLPGDIRRGEAMLVDPVFARARRVATVLREFGLTAASTKATR